MFVDVTRSASPLHPPATVHGRQQLLTHLHISGQSPGINTSAVGELQLGVDNIRRDPDGYKCSVSAQHLIVVAARNKEMSPLVCPHWPPSRVPSPDLELCHYSFQRWSRRKNSFQKRKRLKHGMIVRTVKQKRKRRLHLLENTAGIQMNLFINHGKEYLLLKKANNLWDIPLMLIYIEGSLLNIAPYLSIKCDT